MFIRTSELLKLVESAASAQGAAAELRIINAQLLTSIDWLRAKVNQLEKERVVLLRETTKLSFPLVEIAREHPTNSMSVTIPPGMALPTFEDVGDDAANQLGISHDAAGEIQYAP